MSNAKGTDLTTTVEQQCEIVFSEEDDMSILEVAIPFTFTEFDLTDAKGKWKFLVAYLL